MTFVIFAEPRTGSNHLVSLLNSHPEVVCYGEIFRPKYRPSSRINESLSEWNNPQWRQKKPVRFLNDVAKVSNPNSKLGFKLFLNHLKQIKIDLLAQNIKIIRLQRDNFLARYSSMLAAKKTGLGSLTIYEKAKKPRVVFCEKAFDAFIKSKFKEKKRIEKRLSKLKGKQVLTIQYYELGDFNTHYKILEYLGVEDTSFELSSTLAKRSRADILDRFKNQSDVLEFFRKHPEYSSWQSEKH